MGDKTASLNLDLIFRAKCLLTEEVLTASGPLLATVQTVCRAGAERVSMLKCGLWGGEGSVLWLLLLSCRMCRFPCQRGCARTGGMRRVAAG